MNKLFYFKIGLLTMISTTFIGSTNYVVYSQINNKTNFNNQIDNNNSYSNYDGETKNYTDFNSYEPIYSDSNFVTISTNDGTLGMSNNKKTLILTSYNGSILWLNTLTTNQDLINWIKTNKVNSNLNNYVVKSYLKMINQNKLIVLFGEDNSNTTNNLIISIDLNSGKITNSNNNYAINSVDINNPDIVLETTETNKFIVVNSKNQWNKNIDVNRFEFNNGSITKAKETIAGAALNSDDMFMGCVAGKIGSNINYLLFASYSVGANNLAKSSLYLIGVDNTLKRVVANNNSIILTIGNKSATVSQNDLSGAYDYRYENSFKQLLYVGDRNNWYNNEEGSIKIVVPYYLKFNQNKNWIQKYDGGIYVLKINTNQNNTKSIQSGSTNWSGRINQMSIVNENVFTATEYTNDNYSNNNYGNAANVIDIKNVTYNNDRGFFAKKVVNENNGSNLKNVARLVGISNDADNDNISVAVRNKNTKKFYIYTGKWSDGNYNNLNQSAVYDNVMLLNNPSVDIQKDNTFKQSIASSVTDEKLIPFLKYKQNNSDYSNASDKWNTTIENKLANDNDGQLSFNYKVEYNAPFNNKIKISYFVDCSINHLYKLSNINFQFVTTKDVDTDKYNQIENLRKFKPANEITKQNIIDCFIKYNIKDIDNNDFNISENLITLTPLDNNTKLKVDINLPKDKFPSQPNDKFNFSYTFINFLDDSQYTHSYDKQPNETIKNKYPSEITLTDLFNNVIHLGNSYSKNETDWKIEWGNKDDINGELTINSLTYNNKELNQLPDRIKNVISNPITYKNLKSTTDLININDIKINNIYLLDDNLKPIDIWNQYKSAANSNDINKIKETYIYKAIDTSNFIEDFSNLKIELNNIATVNSDQYFDYKITINKDSKLAYKVNNNNVIFSDDYKNKLIEKYKDKYPINLKQNIIIQSTKLNVNKDFVDNNKIDFNNKVNTITIDLNKTTINNLSNNTTLKSFEKHFNYYQLELLKMFNYTKDYNPIFDLYKVDATNNTSNINLDFIDKSNNKTTTYKINVINFKKLNGVLVDQQLVADNSNLSYNTVSQSIVIDISNQPLLGLNKNISMNEFTNNFNPKYQNEILKVFEWNNNYNPTFGQINKQTNNTLNFDINFKLKDVTLKNDLSDNQINEITLNVTIIGFKNNNIKNVILITIISILCVAILFALITYAIITKRKPKPYLRDLTKYIKKIKR